MTRPRPPAAPSSINAVAGAGNNDGCLSYLKWRAGYIDTSQAQRAIGRNRLIEIGKEYLGSWS